MTDVWADGRPTRRTLVLDLLTAAGFGLVAVPVQLLQAPSAAVAAALLTVALAVRRVLMPAMVVLAVAAAVLQVATTTVAPLADLAYPVLFFTLGTHRDRRAQIVGFAAAVTAVLVAGVWGGLTAGGEEPLGRGFAWVVAVALASITAVATVGGWVAGFVRLQARRAVQTRIDAQLDAAERRRLSEAFDQEQERRRIAADMHDLVAHSWAVVAAQADGARYALRTSPQDAEGALEVIGETARSAMSDLGTILAQLRYHAEADASPGPEQQARLVQRMVASGMVLDLQERGERSASPLLGLTAHRLLSESLTNALKHGRLADPVVVRQDWTDGYRLTVTNTVDAPTAPDRPSGSADTGHGIVGMTERAAVAGGHLVSRRVGDRWQVEAFVPRPTRQESP